MTREEMVNKILKDIETWDRTSLIEETKARMQESLEGMDDDCLLSYYNAQFPSC